MKEIKVGEVSRGSYQLHLHNNDPSRWKRRDGTQCIKDKDMSGGPDESVEEENHTCIQEGNSSDSDWMMGRICLELLANTREVTELSSNKVQFPKKQGAWA